MCSRWLHWPSAARMSEETVEGLQRFPINMRYPRELRDSVEKLTLLPIVTAAGATTTLGAVADLVCHRWSAPRFEARMPA